MNKLRLGSRTSKLAMWQADLVAKKLVDRENKVDIIGIKSSGDLSLGGNLSDNIGQFVKSVDEKLILGEIDIAVHSSKDVPVNHDGRISTLAYLERGATSDIILFSFKAEGSQRLIEVMSSSNSNGLNEVLEAFPKGGRIGTSSVRRQSFFLSRRDDVIPLAIRGRVETRIRRLLEGRIEAIILAEAGLQRLGALNALPEGSNDIYAMRICPDDWPTAPGQGAVTVHCLTERFEELAWARERLNHYPTESSVTEERRILRSLGGGCKSPVGVECLNGESYGYMAPENWREQYSFGSTFELSRIDKNGSVFKSEALSKSIEMPLLKSSSKLISTLNSERMGNKLSNRGIEVINIPVIELTEIRKNWPEFNLDTSLPRDEWPIMVLTSPFASRCASKMVDHIPDLAKIQWLAMGAGTARSCFQNGNPASICANAGSSRELERYIRENIPITVKLLIPRSSVGNERMKNNLKKFGYIVDSWIGYENSRRDVNLDGIDRDDVLLISSPSSARSWDKNELAVPSTVFCMGTTTKTEIQKIERFNKSQLVVLDGSVTESVSIWWDENRGRKNEV